MTTRDTSSSSASSSIPSARTVTRYYIDRDGQLYHVDSGAPAAVDDSYGVYLASEVDPLLAALAAQDEEMARMSAKLEAGTLHVLYCNGNHEERVGKAGMICNCTLGKEIKQLRARAEAAEAALRDAPKCPIGNWTQADADYWFAEYSTWRVRAHIVASTAEAG